MAKGTGRLSLNGRKNSAKKVLSSPLSYLFLLIDDPMINSYLLVRSVCDRHSIRTKPSCGTINIHGAPFDYLFRWKWLKHHWEKSVITLIRIHFIQSSPFTYVIIGTPGRCNDSSVCSRAISSEVIQIWTRSHLIADSAVPLVWTCLKPYAERLNIHFLSLHREGMQ